MAKKKEESTNEKIVRLYKEGYSFDEISRTMDIPKNNIIGIVEKYFPDYQNYEQPQIDHSVVEDKDKAAKGKFPGVPFLKRGGKSEPEKVTINLEMNEEGFVDKTSGQIAKMLKNGRGVSDIAEFFNKTKADVVAVREVMDEHFKRVEAHKKPEPPKPVDPEPNKFSNFATGLEDEQPKATRPKYTPPTYSKRDDPKPVSASYGLADNKPAEDTAAVTENTDVAEDTKVNDTVVDTAVDTTVTETVSEPVVESIGGDAIDEAEMLRKIVEEANLPPIIEKDKKEDHKVSLVPDDDNGSSSTVPVEEHKVSLVDDDISMEVLEIPSIDAVSPEEIEKELKKAPDPVEEIPEIGIDNITEEVTEEVKEVYPGMSALEKMKQFAQEQIALNNKKIEELKSKKTDAENNAFDSNTKVEAMKKEIEDMQAKLLILIDEKDKAGKVVSDINDEIEAINKEIADYSTYL